ncbi:MAG: YfhO family protein [Thermoflexales bacterium]|nr:YfhO family protein [Thermoflexales bacterium]
MRRLSNFQHWPSVALIIAPTVLLLPIVLGGVLYWGVPLMQFYPWQKLAAEMWRAGQLPLWNSFVGSGAPLAANLQTGAFYPGNFLYLILPTEYALGYTALLHVILAGWFMYAYLRTLKLSTFAAVLGALAFQLNGFLIARLGFMSITVTLPWLAAWLWRTEKLMVREQGAGSKEAMWLAVVIGLGVLAGHAQTAVYGLIFVSAYFVWRVIYPHPNPPPSKSALPGEGTPRRRVAVSLISFALAVIIGLGLAAIQLLPAAELTRESQRAGGLESIKILTHSYWPPRLITLLSPDFFGNPAQNNFWGYDNYWENAAYIGLLPLLLALWMMGKGLRDWGSGIRRRVNDSANQRTSESSLVTRHSSLITFFTLSTLVSLVLAVGWFTPIYVWLYENAPGFDLFQGPVRWLVVTIPALCGLAALGAQRWLDHGFSRRAANRLIVLGLAAALAGLVAVAVLSGRVTTFGPATLRLGLLLGLIGWMFRQRIRDRRPQLIVVGLVALDLISAHFALNPVLPAEVYHAPNPAADAIRADGGQGRVFYLDVDENALKFGTYLAQNKQFTGYGPNELSHWLNFRQTLLPNLAMIDHIPSASNFDSLIIGRYQTVLDRINATSLAEAQAWVNQLNAAYILSPRALDLPIVYQTPDVTVYRNEQVWPRARIVPDRTDFPDNSSVRGASIESLTDSGNTVTIRAVSPTSGYLILADVYYPGWQAWVDGTPTPIEVANTAFRAVKVAAGDHTIEFRYEPASVQIGAAITLTCGLIVLLALLLRRRVRA